MKVKGFAVLVLIFITNLFFLTPVYAHRLKTDGTIGAVLHVDPADDPVAGEPSNFFFEFKDTQNKFDPKNCECRVTILQAGKDIYSDNLFQNTTNPTLSDAVLSYTFPQKDIYKIRVEGKPNTPDSFQEFRLEYDIRVAKESQSANSVDQSNQQSWFGTHNIHFIGAAIIIVGLMVGLIIQNSKKS